MNEKLISALLEISHITEIMGEVGKQLAYSRAVIELKKLKYVISSENIHDIAKLSGIGEHILKIINEFITTGSIKELDMLRRSKKVKAYIELNKILGVGPSTIKKWLSMKVDNLSKLRRAVGTGRIKLTNMQKWGLIYYDDLNTKIPRDEITAICSQIKVILSELDNEILFEPTGSYRRGQSQCGDIDILISQRSSPFNDYLLDQLAEILSKDPNFVTILSAGSERITFLYKSEFSNIVRQIDILYIKYSSYYAALLYFTGSWDFNQSIRGYAKSKGFKLNQSGLFRYPNGTPMPINSEEDIFNILGLQYIPPRDRIGPL